MTEAKETVQSDHLEFEIAKLELRPGDVLVIRPKEPISMTSIARMENYIKQMLPEYVKVAIFNISVDLTVLALGVEKRCRNCAHWGEEAIMAGERPTVDARPCNLEPVDTRTMQLNQFAIFHEDGGSILCGPNFGCVNFEQKEIQSDD